jgi:hypothetical protein
MSDSVHALPKPSEPKHDALALADVWESAQVLTAFADAVVANPERLPKRSRRTDLHSGNLTQVIGMLRQKLGAAEQALSGASGGAASAKTKRPVAPRDPKESSSASPASASMAALRERARESMKQLAREGTLVDSAQFLEEWGRSKQALSKAQAANRVFVLDIEGRRYLPAFFVDTRYDRAKLEKVSKALGPLPGASKLQFFLNARGSLGGRTPLEALADGQLDKVLAAAEGFVQG